MPTDSPTKPKKAKGCLPFRNIFLGLLVFSCLFYVFFLRGALQQIRESNEVLYARDMGLSFFAYACDHGGKYPEGKTSTEVFQKLLDGGYLGTENGKEYDYLKILYYPMPGKVKAAPGTKILKPENVCWDITCCMDEHSPDSLPIVFLTGYKITYRAGASATPLPHPPRSWSDWWQGKDYPKFIAVNYKNNDSQKINLAPNGTVPNFIPADFNPMGKTYHQLTPDGELPP